MGGGHRAGSARTRMARRSGQERRWGGSGDSVAVVAWQRQWWGEAPHSAARRQRQVDSPAGYGSAFKCKGCRAACNTLGVGRLAAWVEMANSSSTDTTLCSRPPDSAAGPGATQRGGSGTAKRWSWGVTRPGQTGSWIQLITGRVVESTAGQWQGSTVKWPAFEVKDKGRCDRNSTAGQAGASNHLTVGKTAGTTCTGEMQPRRHCVIAR